MHCVEWHGKRQISQAHLRTLELVHGHLEFFEVVVLDALLKRLAHHLVRERVLFGKAGGRNGLQARKERLIAYVHTLEGSEGLVVQAIVIAIVTVGRGALRMSLQIGFVFLGKKSVLRGDARFNGGGSCQGRRACQEGPAADE